MKQSEYSLGVIRGGAWRLGAVRCRSAFRHGSAPGLRYLLGFRLARTGYFRVIRGSAWDNVAEYCRSADRGSWLAPGNRDRDLGFRIAKELKNDSRRVSRGGSWYGAAWRNDAGLCRSAYRGIWGDPSDRDYNLGFRLAKEIKNEAC